MHSRLVLRHYGIIYRYRILRSGFLLSIIGDFMFTLSRWNLCCIIISNKLLKLYRGHLPSIDWLDGVLFMYSWFVLRYHWTICRYWSLRYGILLGFIGICMLKLSRRYIFCIVFNNGVLKLSCRNIYFLSIEHQLLELLRGNLPSFHGLDGLHGLRRWFLLRISCFVSCFRSMCGWKVRSFLCNLVLKLWGWILPGVDRFFSLLFMHSRLVLRHYGIICRHRILRSRNLFNRICFNMF